MSIVLRTFFPLFTILSFYTKHMFKFIYVNQLIHMVILVDNVDKFVHNLIISGFADFCHVENFLESFSLIHHSSTGFVHIARTTFSRLILPVSARTCLTLPILSDVYIKPFFLQLFMVFLLRAVLTSALFFVKVKTLKQRVDFSVPTFFATQSAFTSKTDCVAFIMHKKHTFFPMIYLVNSDIKEDFS